MNKKLYLSSDNKYIAGVCGGIAKYLGIDPTIVRILFALAAVCSYLIPVIIIYIIFWAIIPVE